MKTTLSFQRPSARKAQDATPAVAVPPPALRLVRTPEAQRKGNNAAGSTRFHVRLPLAHKRFLEARAEASGSTLTTLLRGLLEDWLAGTVTVAVAPVAPADDRERLSLDLPTPLYRQVKARVSADGYRLTDVTVGLIERLMASARRR
ncbi:TPA: hypothetical protein QDB15_000010 [Burkholderia vietnamiensis]|uniref:Uncharacterized protein n=1 Tax=Pandoraea apista TaxID=93218 RepID=A0A5E5P1J6_9BURK|nr:MULTISPECIES: hypothetical protein [Burkholderiaceae]MCA8206284.1 hypothetical protein [Burkholderia vietnamiensis]VVG70448.1 hypothetical protein PAP18089_01408 [Pandoraea apista]HDR8943082.1 hypothetical protein [Burkholderia vietnamiensis]HDR9116286.1 hypothetical protein [Burkholderia vietnamiensis]HDR9205332.1 hypothetical protein [Burkholderia vietnamiensis]